MILLVIFCSITGIRLAVHSSESCNEVTQIFIPYTPPLVELFLVLNCEQITLI